MLPSLRFPNLNDGPFIFRLSPLNVTPGPSWASNTLGIRWEDTQFRPWFTFLSHQGYVGKLYLDQTWLSAPTEQWDLNISLASQVEEFKIWDADIASSNIATDTVTNVTSVSVINKCYNAIIYPCQYLEVTFLVRWDQAVSNNVSKILFITRHSPGSQTTMNCPQIMISQE